MKYPLAFWQSVTLGLKPYFSPSHWIRSAFDALSGTSIPSLDVLAGKRKSLGEGIVWSLAIGRGLARVKASEQTRARKNLENIIGDRPELEDGSISINSIILLNRVKAAGAYQGVFIRRGRHCSIGDLGRGFRSMQTCRTGRSDTPFLKYISQVQALCLQGIH